jgi:hypothetical protein
MGNLSKRKARKTIEKEEKRVLDRLKSLSLDHGRGLLIYAKTCKQISLYLDRMYANGVHLDRDLKPTGNPSDAGRMWYRKLDEEMRYLRAIPDIVGRLNTG